MENNFEIDGFETFNKVIIDFTATWCGPCKALNSILDDISDNTEIKVFKIDVDRNQGLAVEYGIRSVPTMLCYKRGELINRLTGLKRKEEIIEVFN